VQTQRRCFTPLTDIVSCLAARADCKVANKYEFQILTGSGVVFAGYTRDCRPCGGARSHVSRNIAGAVRVLCVLF